MSTSIGNLLQANGDYTEPPEVRIIKEFVQKNYQETVSIQMQPNRIVISVHSAALANTLRFRLVELKELCQTEQPVVLQIRA